MLVMGHSWNCIGAFAVMVVFVGSVEGVLPKYVV
jgi:hypothetical protein